MTQPVGASRGEVIPYWHRWYEHAAVRLVRPDLSTVTIAPITTTALGLSAEVALPGQRSGEPVPVWAGGGVVSRWR